MKTRDTVTGRNLRRRSPEERLAPGDKLLVAKKCGKFFEMRRVDQAKRNMLAELNQIIKEIPIVRHASSKHLSSIFLEDRE
jgi:hypothetical protein